jgi:hypothetical protein
VDVLQTFVDGGNEFVWMTQLVDGLGGSKLAMPVEIVQFCWKYNLQRLENLPEVKGCKVSSFNLVARRRIEFVFWYVTLNVVENLTRLIVSSPSG